MDATTFHNLLIKEFSLGDLSIDEQTDYVNQIGELVLQGVLIKSLAALDNEEASQLETFIDSGKESDEVIEFLRSTIPGFVDLVHDEIKVVQTDLAASMGTNI